MEDRALPTGDTLAHAVALQRSGRSDEALDELERVRRRTPDDPRLFLYWARVLRARGRHDQARQLYHLALAKQPGHLETSLDLGRAELQAGRLPIAVKIFERALAATPGDPRLLRGIGEAHQRAGRCGAAIEPLQAAVAHDPTDADTRARLGECLVEVHRYDEAVAHLEAVVAQGSHDLGLDLTTHFLLVRAQLARREPQAAERTARAMREHATATIERLAKEDPEVRPDDVAEAIGLVDALTHYITGVAQTQRQRLADALANLRAARHLDAGFVVARLAEVGVLQRLGRYSEMWALLARMPEAIDADAGLFSSAERRRLLAALAMIELDDLDRAGTLLQGADETSPELDVGHVALALARGRRDEASQLDERETAERHLRRFRLRIQEHTLHRGAIDLEAQVTSIELLLGLGDLTTAEARIEEALQLAPADPVLHALHGILHAQRDEHADAAACFRTSLRADPSAHSVRVRLGHALLHLGQPEQAEREYRTILTTADRNVEAHAGLAQSMMALGDRGHLPAYEDAASSFETALALESTMHGDVAARTASTCLRPVQRAALECGRGFALVRLYEERHGVRHLREAHRAFEAARRIDPSNVHAARAARVAGVRLSALRGATDRVGGPLLLVLALASLVLVQISFFFSWPQDEHIDATTYGVLTPALLLFVVVALYLPQIAQLRVGGLHLQKSSAERMADFEPLQLIRDDRPFELQGLTISNLSLSNLRLLGGASADAHVDPAHELPPSSARSRRERPLPAS